MTIVHDILQQMPAIRQPQRKFLTVLFATILALRGRVTCRNLSRYCEYSERTIARQFRATFDWPDFHQRVMTAALEPRSELISAPDASFIPKSGKQTFGLGHFFNGCASRAERGLEISTLAVVEVTRRCALTLAVAQPLPGADKAASNPAAEETRIDFYKQQLREQRHRLPERVTYHCVDGYFAKQKYIDEVVALKLHSITKLRGDANCLFLYTGPHPKRRGPKRQCGGQVNFHSLRRFEYLGALEGGAYVQLYTALVWHVSLKRKLRVVVLVNRKDPHKPRYIVLASTDLELDGRRLVELYRARFQIEICQSQPAKMPWRPLRLLTAIIIYLRGLVKREDIIDVDLLSGDHDFFNQALRNRLAIDKGETVEIFPQQLTKVIDMVDHCLPVEGLL